MTTEPKHAPTPWKIGHRRKSRIPDSDAVMCRIDGPDSIIGEIDFEFDAAFIVRAVNSHDALVGACEAILAYSDTCLINPHNPCWNNREGDKQGEVACPVCYARAALAKAKGE